MFADIGDEQSIAESLSTFSGHIANIVEMERALALPALVLLDEAGAGTDPVEGGALAMAIIEHFRLRGATVIATTHYDSLKSYASTTEGVMPAGFGFDPKTFAPTYRLNYGSPGSSLAFEIATRLGLPADRSSSGRGRTAASASRSSPSTSRRSQRDMQALEHERRLVARERETLARATAKLQAREQELRNREETFKRRLDERIEERLRDARRRDRCGRRRAEGADRRAGRRRGAARAPRLVPTGETGAARADARAAVDAIGERLRASGDGGRGGPAAAARATRTARRRSAIACSSAPSASRASCKALHDREAKWTSAASGCARGSTSCGCSRPPRRSDSQPARVRVNVELQPREGIADRAERDRLQRRRGAGPDREVPRRGAAQRAAESCGSIHGYGTGQLRRAIAEFLQTHPFVANFGPAPPRTRAAAGSRSSELKE